jgi:putative ABC transport system permease protein
MGIDVVSGRGILASDDGGAPRVLVVNESFAARYFGGDVIGRRISFGNSPAPAWWTIVGVAGDVSNFAIRAGEGAGPDPTATPDAPAAYLPYAQSVTMFAPSQMSVVARTLGDPLALVPDVRATLVQLDPSLAASRILPMEALVDAALARDRFVTVLLALFAATAVLLAAIGIYGVVSHGVSRRMREMGIRTALGAERADLGLIVIGGGLRLAVAGIVVGFVGAWIATRVLGSLLYGVQATDPLTFTVTAFLLAGVALLASWLPTRRLGRVDPVSVLRSE